MSHRHGCPATDYPPRPCRCVPYLDAGPSSPTADGPCPDCGRPVPAASERNGAACGCDHAAPCELHAAEPARPYYHRACSRRTLRRRLERIAAR